MGNEFAQEREWDHANSLDWALLDRLEYRGIQMLVRDLNFLYRSLISVHSMEFSHSGFEWLDCHDATRSIIAYLRRGNGEKFIVVILNFSMVEILNYRVGVPVFGLYKEILSSNCEIYGGDGAAINGELYSDAISHMGYPYSLLLDLSPLAGMIVTLLE